MSSGGFVSVAAATPNSAAEARKINCTVLLYCSKPSRRVELECCSPSHTAVQSQMPWTTWLMQQQMLRGAGGIPLMALYAILLHSSQSVALPSHFDSCTLGKSRPKGICRNVTFFGSQTWRPRLGSGKRMLTRKAMAAGGGGSGAAAADGFRTVCESSVSVEAEDLTKNGLFFFSTLFPGCEEGKEKNQKKKKGKHSAGPAAAHVRVVK